MGVTKIDAAVTAPTKELLEAKLGALGLEPHWWGNAPGDTYSRHSHGYHKVLFCLSGSIVFHTKDGDIELGPGDRIDVEPGTEHGATVGPAGVECIEGWMEP